MSTPSFLSVVGTAAVLVLLAVDLPAQKKGGGGTAPPPAPAIAFADNGIKVMNADGTNVRTVVALRRGEYASFPSWSPDGLQLAFSGGLGGQLGIWKVNVDGSALQLLAPQAFQSFTDWTRVPAPDGRHKIAFLDAGVGGGDDVFVVNTDGTGLQNLTSSPEWEQCATWTRDATGLWCGVDAWSSGVSVLLLAAQPGGGIAVTAAPVALSGWYFSDCRVAHTSDLILFRGGAWFPQLTIQVLDPIALPWTPQQVYADGAVLGAPSFAPDDSRVVLRRNGKNGGIFTANPDGSGSVRIRSSGVWPCWRHN